MTIIASNSITVSNINDGTITHTAYSYSADGKDRFTTVYPNLNLGDNTKTFVGTEDEASNLRGSIRIEPATQKTQDGDFYYLTAKAPRDNYDWFRFFLIPDTATPNVTKVAVKPNTKYTFSVLLKGTGQHTIYAYQNWTAPNTPWSLQINLTSEWKIYTFTVTSSNVIPDRNVQFFIRSNNGTEINLKYPKVEPGSNATPHMPSSSEVTTADWPKYRGEYSDMSSEQSTNPSDYTWSLIRGDDGKPGLNGKDGIAGKDGVGIKTTVITYAISTNGTTAPNTGWTSSVPGLIKGQYLWTKTVWTYTDNSSETGYTVSYISKDGNNGHDGIAGKDGTGISNTIIEYVGAVSGTSKPTSGWTSTIPTVPAGQYLWTRTTWQYTDGTSEQGYINALMGLTGASGRDGIAGKDGKGIKATAITYQASTNGTTAPTGTWSTSVPTVPKGSFLWTRTIWTYTDNTTETGYAVAYMGTNGNNGTNGIAGKDGVGIKTTTITYAGSTSGTTAPTSGWTSTVPTVAAGSYLWTKTVWTYTDNTSETGYSVGKMGNTGPAGPAGSNGDPGKVIQQNTEPTNKFLDMLWQYTGTEPLNATGITVLSNIIYVWNGTAWQIWLLNPQNIQAVNAWITNAMIGNAAIKLANIDTATITELSAVTATLGDVEAGSITNDISYGFVAQGNHHYLGNSVINYRGINISETMTLDNVLQYTQSMGFDAITGLFFQRLNENQDVISNIRLIEIGNNEMGLYVGNATESATLTSKGLTLSTDVPWTTLSPTNGFSGGSIQFSVQNGVEFFSIAGLSVPQMNATQWYQAASLPAGSIAIPSINRVYPISGNNNAWDLLINPAGGVFIRCQAAVSATSNLVNGGCGFPIG